jgi:hypothetical protein
MKLYHFTYEGALSSILSEGLTRGDIPVSPNGAMNAVWFTTDRNPNGHGVYGDGARSIVTPEIAAMSATPLSLGETLYFPDKQKIRIRVDLATSKTHGLCKWLDFAKKMKIDPEWLKAVHGAAGDNPKPHTWWLWFGVMPPEQFATVEVRDINGEYVSIWERPSLLSDDIRIHLPSVSPMA